jgi:Transmembrane protein 43
VFLSWNEGRAVQAIVGLKDAASQVVEAEGSGPSPANDNKLVHVVGTATAQSPIEDSQAGITFAGQVAVALRAEMYQWKEEKKEDTQNNVGGGTTTTTTYDYSRVWSDKPINSSEFKHPENHDIRRCRSATHSSRQAMRNWGAGRSTPMSSAA